MIQNARFQSVLWCKKVRNEGRRATDLFCTMFCLLLGESFVPIVQFYTVNGDCIFIWANIQDNEKS